MTPRVFISSRIRELEEERVTVEEAVKELLNNENIVYKTWSWEKVSKERPSGNAPDGVQSKGLKNSDVYLLILGADTDLKRKFLQRIKNMKKLILNLI